MENRAGTSSRFIWGRDSEPLEKGWRLKPGPQMGGGYTKGVVTSRHGISKTPRFFPAVWEIKEGKIGLFYSPDPWTQRDRVKTVPGNNLSSHYLNPLRMRTAGHAPGPMFHRDDEKRISEVLYLSIILLFSLFLYFRCWWNVSTWETRTCIIAFGLALIQVSCASNFVYLYHSISFTWLLLLAR